MTGPDGEATGAIWAAAGPANAISSSETRNGKRAFISIDSCHYIVVMLKVMIAPVTPFQQNCSIVWDSDTMEGTAVDPGGDFEVLQQAIDEQGIKVTKVLLTHGHVDHASAAGTMADHYGVKIEGPHKDDLYLIEGLPDSGRKYNFPAYKPFVPDRWLDNGETVSLGNLSFDVVHCPGHTPGHVVFVHKPSKVAFVGDVLFRGSVGRTDLP